MKRYMWPSAASELAPSKSADTVKEKLTVESLDNHVYFYSYVDDDRILALMKTIRVKDSVLRNERDTRALPDGFPMTPIWLHISTGGGNLFSGLAAADQLETIKTPIYSLVEGYCASAGTFISMSCTKRFATPSSFMLIHQFSSFTFGTYEEFKDDMKLQEMLMNKLVKFYIEHSKLDEEKVRELLKHDSWFDSEQCKELGLVDDVYAMGK